MGRQSLQANETLTSDGIHTKAALAGAYNPAIFDREIVTSVSRITQLNSIGLSSLQRAAARWKANSTQNAGAGGLQSRASLFETHSLAI